MISFYVIPPKNDNEESFSQRRKDLYLFNTVFFCLQMFSFATGYFHLLCFSFHKWHKMNLLQLLPLFFPFVFYENALYLCIEK